jgi:tRNA pseudouridine32 synthase/23S rRNA pseudouridine746 synthase
MFHSFLSNNSTELPAKFTYPFCYKPNPLAVMAAEEVKEYLVSQTQWNDELKRGKMFGVLVVKNQNNQLGYLAGFSGRIADSYHHSFFVPPIYDLKESSGFFLREEDCISNLNEKIENLLSDENYISLKNSWQKLNDDFLLFLEESQKQLAYNKKCRAERRAQSLSEEENLRLTKESQFQKAQFKRDKQIWQNKLSELRTRLDKYETEISELQNLRKQSSALLQQKIFEQFELFNAKGERKNLCQIFSDYGNLIPPGGAGECAAPKLLQHAYKNNFKPVCMAEFWWGESPVGVVRNHGCFYPSCTSKCGPILSFMLQGLEVEENPLSVAVSLEHQVKIIYEDDYILVLDKPHGMLSVPGKESLSSIYDFVNQRWKNLSGPLIVHRLDMATSGIILIAKDKISHQNLQAQFKNRVVKKTYIAILDGIVEEDEGTIDLPLLPDFNNRPCQMVDFKLGKPAYTSYKVLERGNDFTRMEFSPYTGRTHQLRVHAAHKSGLNHPIKGDLLYGNAADRLYLHAQSISFIHPNSGNTISFTSLPDF